MTAAAFSATSGAVQDAPSPHDPSPARAVRLRRGEARDAPGLRRLIAALNADEGNPSLATEDDVRRDLIGQAIVIVAEADGTGLVGYATGHPTYDTGHAEPGLYIGDLYVAPDHRRQGIARALVAAMARAGHARGARHLWLTAQATNAAAHAFYRRLGSRGEAVMAFAVVQQDFLNIAAEPSR